MLRSTFKLLRDWADFQNRSRKDLAQQHICATLADSATSLGRDSEQLRAVAVHPAKSEQSVWLKNLGNPGSFIHTPYSIQQ